MSIIYLLILNPRLGILHTSRHSGQNIVLCRVCRDAIYLRKHLSQYVWLQGRILGTRDGFNGSRQIAQLNLEYTAELLLEIEPSAIVTDATENFLHKLLIL